VPHGLDAAATGLRFTCTSSGDMKMLMRVAGTPSSSGSCTARTSITLPSAGETTSRSSAGAIRSGSRKNQQQNPTPSAHRIQPPGNPTRAARPSTAATTPITRQPSGAMRIGPGTLSFGCGRPADCSAATA
jgi:hypothetical protein